MYIKINPNWLSSHTEVDLFSIINSKIIKINHVGEIESWSLKILKSKEVFIKQEDWSLFFNSISINSLDLVSLKNKIDLILINFTHNKNEESFKIIQTISSQLNDVLLKKKDILSFDGELQSKIILRTLLVSKMSHFFPFIRKCLKEEELILSSLLCDISQIQDKNTDFSMHHLKSARIVQNFVSKDVYLGILHHHETMGGQGPFKYDSDRSHIYGQIIHICDEFIESLKSKKDFESFVSSKHDPEIFLGLKQTYKNLF